MDNHMIEMLYYAIENLSALDNPFETEETQSVQANFFEKYVKSCDYDKDEEAQFALNDVACAERRNAFKVGFNTAIKLLL